ncbi:unnamed protein product [Clonostachys rhizophaga]|uniref:Uncharacterized protein n=1 Tax=Clonostachys rhizophaga TaxID=160324 RepID=A0A9N9V2F2_9HYPO|nr:unnamed protein product [Clonostachys rhizophaga]
MSCNKPAPLPEFTPSDIPDLTGYVAIVTGGNSGIGFETTKQLAMRNARVYIASRSQQRVDEAISQMNTAVGRALDLHFLQMDLQDLQSVKLAATLFAHQESHLDILINNAGVMTVPFKLTKDGYETQIQVNFLALFVFTTTLLPLLLSTASQYSTPNRVRVINVCSDLAFMGPKTIQFDDLNMTNTKGMMELMQRYGHSKQAAIRHAKELNDRYSHQGENKDTLVASRPFSLTVQTGVTAYSCHPGIVKSNLQSHDPTIVGKTMRTVMKYTASMTPLEGAINSLFLATSPLAPERGQGKFFIPVTKVNPKAEDWLNDRETNARLWEHCSGILAQIP